MPTAELSLSPEGQVYLDQSPQTREILPQPTFEKLAPWFTLPYPQGLLQLGISGFNDLPPSFTFWQSFSRRFVAEACKLSILSNLQQLNPEEVQSIIAEAPFIRGFEYLQL